MSDRSTTAPPRRCKHDIEHSAERPHALAVNPAGTPAELRELLEEGA